VPNLIFRFPAGRYHATPWGHHVNEGLVEWPPSPWRIIRTLLASGFATQRWSSLPDEARRLVSALASVDPAFLLPPAAPSHVRHWMPTNDKPTRVLDPFLVVSRSIPVVVHYECDPDASLMALLAKLAAGVSYLGRAESWAAARLLAGRPETNGDRWCRAVESVPPGAEGLRLLAPMLPEAYAGYRETTASSDTGRRSPGARHDRLPNDIAECLLADTATLQKDGWSDPPGSRWALYARPSDAVSPPSPHRRLRRSSSGAIDAVVLALSPTPAPDGRRGVRPLMARAVPQAELIHQSAIAALGAEAPTCEVLTGRTPDGGHLRGQHGHAHYFPLDLDCDGRLDHVAIYAPAGLDERAQRALAAVQRTWTRGQVGNLAVRVVGRGSIDQIRDQLAAVSGRTSTLFGEGRVWSSITPFVPPRHLKRNRHTLEDQVRAELASRGKPAPVSVELLAPFELAKRRFFAYVTTRRAGKPQPPAPVSFGVRITFDAPVRGPIAIGYASHFGLGLFGADRT